MTTIKEIAEVCGVSQEAIRKWCRRNQVSKVGKHWELSETDVESIYRYYGVEVANRTQPSEPTKSTCETNTTETIDILLEQLRAKDEQITNLTAALAAAQEQASAALLLHAADRREDIMPSLDDGQVRTKPRLGWFGRLFGRN